MPPIKLLRLFGASALLIAISSAGTVLAAEPAPYGPLDGLKIVKAEDKVDAPRTPPPPVALVLFDGSNLDEWQSVDGKAAAAWTLVPGGVVQVRHGGIKTKRNFDGHFRLHVEFRVPYLPTAKGQARGNSGIYLQGRYEVQVLDSYGLDSQNNDCGGIYEVAKPLVNACKAPTVWQCYDIDFRAPVFKDGKKAAPTRISVIQNGVPIHENASVPVDNTRAGLGGDPSTPGPIMLQEHGSPVQYRNIWLVPLN